MATQSTDLAPDLWLLDSPEIQGNVLAGFRKDHQSFVFFQFPDQANGRAWLSDLLKVDGPLGIATTRDVAAHNREFSELKHADPNNADPDLEKVGRAWVNVALTFDGLLTLARDRNDMEPKLGLLYAFRDGPAKPNRAAGLGDTGTSAPDNWTDPFDGKVIHAMVTVAADLPNQLHDKLTALEAISQGRVVWLYQEDGQALADSKEHFGFRDAVSQPFVEGFDDTNQRGPRIPAGQFVLGLPPLGSLPPQPDAGTAPQYLGELAWMQYGSFQVFRRLVQDVAGWEARVNDWYNALPKPAQHSKDLLNARLLGRWPDKDGTPLARLQNDNPKVEDQKMDAKNHHYDNDLQGQKTPMYAHIRRMYRRDKRFDDVRHRLIRRGITFGKPDSAVKGLLFNAFMASIESQFEYLQRSRANNRDFGGVDPVIGVDMDPEGAGTAPAVSPVQPPNFDRFVTTTGALYAFAPSLSALSKLANGEL